MAPGPRTIEALALRAGIYEPAGLLHRGERGALAPLDGLALDLGQLPGA